MLCRPEDLSVIESTDIHLPEDFLAKHCMHNRPLTEVDINHLTMWALEYFRPLLHGTEMDWDLEARIDQIFNELKDLVPNQYKSLVCWHIQKIRPDPWRCGEPSLTWNVIMNKHLVVSFTS